MRALILALLLSGCGVAQMNAASDLSDVPVAGRDGACIRGCTDPYSRCMARSSASDWGSTSGSAMTGCKNAYKVCTATCPVAGR
jgi:hypothetical protein